jgi:hypothetical protein
MFVYATKLDVNGFTLDPSIGEFCLSHPGVSCNNDGKIFSVNMALLLSYPQAVQRYIQKLQERTANDETYSSLRYTGSLVADLHRNLAVNRRAVITLLAALEDPGAELIDDRLMRGKLQEMNEQIRAVLTPEQRKALVARSLVAGVYEKMVDRDSAYEKLKGRAAGSGEAAGAGSRTMADEAKTAARGGPQAQGNASDDDGGVLGGLKDVLFGTTGPRGGHHEGLAESAARSAVRSIGSSVGREIIRGVLGSILGGSRKR